MRDECEEEVLRTVRLDRLVPCPLLAVVNLRQLLRRDALLRDPANDPHDALRHPSAVVARSTLRRYPVDSAVGKDDAKFFLVPIAFVLKPLEQRCDSEPVFRML